MIFSFLLLILLFLLWQKLRTLEERVDSTERRMHGASGQWMPQPPPPPPVVPEPPMAEPLFDVEPMPPAAIPIPAPPPQPPPMPPPLPILEAPILETPIPAALPPELAAGAIEEAASSRPGWESVLGANILNKLGALVLVLGIALFLGYSFAHVGPAGRALMAIAASGAILTAGFFIEKRENYRMFAAGLLASGWASLYFTSYAIHAIPSARILENPLAGLVAMLAVAAGMIAHSLRYRIQSLTALAYTCAYAALVLTDLTSFAAIALVPLAISMLVIAYRFRWFEMGLISAAATYGMLYLKGSPDSTLAVTQSVVLIFWLLFEVFDYLRPERNFALIAINAAGALSISAAAWFKHQPDSMWMFCAAWAVLYLVNAVARAIPARNRAPEAAILISAVLTALAIIARVDGLWMSLALLLEAEVLFAAGHYGNIRWLRILSWPAFVFALMAAFENGTGEAQFAGRTFDTWAFPVAIHAVAYAVNRFLRPGAVYFSYAASLLGTLLIATQAPWPFKGALLLVLSLAILEFGIRRALAEFRIQSYGLLLVGFGLAVFAALDPSRSNLTGLAISCAAALAMAIRSASIPEACGANKDELAVVQTVASVVAAALLAILPAAVIGPTVLSALENTRVGVAWIITGAILAELALRRLPSQLRYAAMPMAAGGFVHVTLIGFIEFVGIKMHSPAIGMDNVSLQSVAAVCAVMIGWYARFARSSRAEAAEFRLAAAGGATLSAALATWAGAPSGITALLWMACAFLLVETGRALRSTELPALGHALALSAFVFFGVSNCLMGEGHLRETALAVAAGNLWLWRRSSNPMLSALHLWIAPAPVGILCYREFPHHYVAAWAAMAAALAVAGRVWNSTQLHYRALTIAAAALVFSLVEQPAALAVAAVVAVLYLLFMLTPSDPAMKPVRLALSVSAALLCSFEIFREVDGGWRTLAWAVQGSLLLGAGFALPERSFRLSGLTLLLACVLKVFIYDLAQLETIYRIVSFIGLGVLLLLASWVYTRFDKQIKSML